MEWTADVAAGDWLKDRLDDGRNWATMHAVVPRGFPAYARIFHPASRDRPVGVAWPPLPYGRHVKEWDAFHAARPEIDSERVTWAGTASAFGTTMHGLAQWHRLAGPRLTEGEDGPRDAAGWRYSDRWRARSSRICVSAAASILARHTTTPDDGFVAVWEGWGGVVGGMGYGPSRVFLTIDEARPTTIRATRSSSPTRPATASTTSSASPRGSRASCRMRSRAVRD